MPLTPPPTTMSASAETSRSLAQSMPAITVAPVAKKTRVVGKTVAVPQAPTIERTQNPFEEARDIAATSGLSTRRGAPGAQSGQGHRAFGAVPGQDSTAKSKSVLSFERRAIRAGFKKDDGTADTKAFRRAYREQLALDKNFVKEDGITPDTAAYERLCQARSASKRGCRDDDGSVNLTQYRHFLKSNAAKVRGYQKDDGSPDVNLYEVERRRISAANRNIVKEDRSPDVRRYLKEVKYNTARNAGFIKPDNSPDISAYHRFLNFRKQHGHLFTTRKAVDMYAEYLTSGRRLPEPPMPAMYRSDETLPSTATSASALQAMHIEGAPEDPVDPVGDFGTYRHEAAARTAHVRRQAEPAGSSATSFAVASGADRFEFSRVASLDTLAQVAAHELSKMDERQSQKSE